jgi:hypothetical protein
MEGHMVYAHNVQRVTISGTMFGGAEEWSTGFFMGKESDDCDDWTQQAAEDILTAWRTFFEASQSRISNVYLTTQVKTAKIDSSGHTVTDQVHYAYPATTLDGAAQTSVYPAQCSLVVTLLSDRPRGKASKGRMYLPGFVANINGGTGKISSNDANDVATTMKTFFDALTSDADFGTDQLILAAKGTGALPALNAQNDYVETIRVGDVIDTQRRRRNGLHETYVSKVLV